MEERAQRKTESEAEVESVLVADPLWYREAIIYEIHVRAFADSNDDGIGDFNGLISKLDYLQDLGVTALWLLPFYPSPLRDGGYDIADYTTINPAYGNLNDFKRFLREAHARGLRVITELVLNHTSNEHEWFQRSRRAPAGSEWRNFYVWSDTPDKYNAARIIFKDFESSNWSWDPLAKAYYWHRFYEHQPDLNFDNPLVQSTLLKTVDFWLELGVDGLRLDAVPYLFERDHTSCENLPETHDFLKKLRQHIDERFTDRMILAEANQWPEDSAAYFGAGDECHMNFHFPLMPRMFMSVQMEDRFPIVDILRQTPAIPASCQWATFLRNHDELTLEMVTDEDRDYMYRVYAEEPTARLNLGIRRRLAPLMKGRRSIELMNSLLFALPGTPVLYYGDELGMGDNIYLGDRDGVRTPMQWSADMNGGFSRANPQRLYLPLVTDPEYHFESVNVQAQQGNPTSLLWWMKRLIALRKQTPVFGTGAIEFLYPENHRVLAFLRSDGKRRVLVVANLSRFSQAVALDLSAYAGSRPLEMFGRSQFPTVGETPYFLSLGPHGFFWLELEPPARTVEAEASDALPMIEVKEHWNAVFKGRARAQLVQSLMRYVTGRRWFRSKARRPANASLVATVPFTGGDAQLVLLRIEYEEGAPETYQVAVDFMAGDAAKTSQDKSPHTAIAHLSVRGEGEAASEGVLVDSLASGPGATSLVESLRSQVGQPPSEEGPLQAAPLDGFAEAAGTGPLVARTSEFEQTNSAYLIGDKILLKVYRQVEEGTNPEQELGRFFNSRASYRVAPRLLGTVEYRRPNREPMTLATAHEFVLNQGTAWQVTLASLDQFFERVLAKEGAAATHAAAPPMQELLGPYSQQVQRLGKRIAELHLTLASETEDANFTPQPFTIFYQQSLFQSAHASLMRTFELLRRRAPSLPEEVRELVKALLPDESAIDARLRRVASRPISLMRVRPHGDLHLGQVLHTGDDFLVIDFEGEPARPLNERRYKRCVLRDVASMLRSFDYAAESALRAGKIRPEDRAVLLPWSEVWSHHVRAAFLNEYLTTVGDSPVLPGNLGDRDLLLEFYETDKCIYEIGYELNNRPDWLSIPLKGLVSLVAKMRPPRES